MTRRIHLPGFSIALFLLPKPMTSSPITIAAVFDILQTVPMADIRTAFDEMEASLDVASEKCPHCGTVNLFPGFSRMRAFVCRECGEGVSLAG
jgi:hypothetical protein